MKIEEITQVLEKEPGAPGTKTWKSLSKFEFKLLVRISLKSLSLSCSSDACIGTSADDNTRNQNHSFHMQRLHCCQKGALSILCKV